MLFDQIIEGLFKLRIRTNKIKKMISTKTFLFFRLIAAVSLIFLVVSGCKKDSDNELIGDELSGIIYAPDGVTPIAGATVYIPTDAAPLKSASVVEAPGAH